MRMSTGLCSTLAAFGLLLAGCSSPQQQPLAPASNPQSQGQAPDPRAQVQAALSSVCAGRGASAAGAYTGGGIHSAVLLSSGGGAHDWSDDLPEAWLPASVGEAQLVACVAEEAENEIEECLYNGPSIHRYQYQVSLRLVEARTGAVVATTVLEGSPPRECQPSEPYDLTRLAGDHVSYAAAEDWMRGYVEGGAPQAAAPPEPGAQEAAEVSVFCGYFGESPVILSSGQPVTLYWTWGAASDEYLQDYIDAASFELTLDGEFLDTSAVSPSLGDCRDAPRCATWRLAPVTLGEGAHTVAMTTILSYEITDGLDLDQNGELDTYPAGPWEAPVCEIIVE